MNPYNIDVVASLNDGNFTHKEVLEATECMNKREMLEWLDKYNLMVKQGKGTDFEDACAEQIMEDMREYEFWKQVEQDFPPYGEIKVELNHSIESLKMQLDKLSKYSNTIINDDKAPIHNYYRKCMRALLKEIDYRNKLANGEVKPFVGKEVKPTTRKRTKRLINN